MTYSSTFSKTQTFTLTHAKHLAAKVATDLKRVQRFYQQPSNEMIFSYEAEIIVLLNYNYLGEVTYGFRKNGNWIEPTLIYVANDLLGISANDDDPGKIRPGANINGATFASYLTYSDNWSNLSESEKKAFKEKLPFKRAEAPEPGVSGYFFEDLIYSSGGRTLSRKNIRSY